MAIDRPRLHCHHTARQHYLMFHRDSGSSYGNSVFNYTYNINSAPLCGGGFWNSVLGGIGMGIGNLFGGMLGNIFGGFGFGGCFGGGFPSFFGGGMTSPFSLYGNSYLNNSANFWSIPSRNNNTESPKSPKPSKKADQDNQTDNPQKLTNEELADLIKNAGDDPKKLQELLDSNKYDLTGEQKKQINDKITKLNKAAEDKAKEEAEKTQDQAPAQVQTQTQAQGKDNWDAGKWTQPSDNISNVKVKSNTGCTPGDGNITINNLQGAFDGSSHLAPVNNHPVAVSSQKHGQTNFPEYLSIADNSQSVHQYKCVGVTTQGYAVYKTPNTDSHNNYYVAVFVNGKYRLTQETQYVELNDIVKPGLADIQECKPETETEEESEE